MDTLHLQDVKTQPLTDNGQNLIAHAEVTAKASDCPKCKHQKLYEFGTRSIRYVDLPMHGKASNGFVCCQSPGYSNVARADGAVFFLPPLPSQPQAAGFFRLLSK